MGNGIKDIKGHILVFTNDICPQPILAITDKDKEFKLCADYSFISESKIEIFNLIYGLILNKNGTATDNDGNGKINFDVYANLEHDQVKFKLTKKSLFLIQKGEMTQCIVNENIHKCNAINIDRSKELGDKLLDQQIEAELGCTLKYLQYKYKIE